MTRRKLLRDMPTYATAGLKVGKVVGVACSEEIDWFDRQRAILLLPCVKIMWQRCWERGLISLFKPVADGGNIVPSR